MRRLVSVILAAAAGVVTLPALAVAATTPVVSTSGLPTDWEAGLIPCATGSASSYAPPHVVGPTAPPAGKGSLQPAGTNSAGVVMLFGPTDSPLLSTLTAFDGYVYVPTTGGAGATFEIDANAGSVDYYLQADVTSTGAWVHPDLTGSTVLHWDSWDNTTNTPGTGSGTLSSFVGAHPSAVFDGFAIQQTNCGPGRFYLDDVHYAVGTTDNTVDFEPSPASLPSAPTAVHMTNGTVGGALTVVATWGAPASSTPAPTYYQVRIQGKSPSGSLTPFRYVNVTSRSLQIAGTKGYLYRFQVVAHNSLGWGSWSAWSNWANPW